MKPIQKMQKARSALILDQPFFGSLALRLRMEEDPTCESMWTDGVSIGFSPSWVDSLSMDELKGVVCHEVMHLSNAHHCRRGDRDHVLWNQAADYAINPLIIAAGMTLPKERLDNPAFHNLETEAIYNRLPRPPKGAGNQGQGAGSGQGQGDGKGQQGKPPQKPNMDPGKCGEVRDLPGQDGNKATDAEKAQNAQDWGIATQQAAQAAKMAGKLPANLSRLIEDLLEPRVDWKEALRQFVDRASRNDYTWKRPNARYFSRNIILPSLYTEELPPIVVAVDTSGSVSNEDLQQFASEIDDILNQYNGTELTVIYCDAKVQHVEHFTTENRPIRLEAKGGGGTDFAPVFKHVAANLETPACLIYLTDLYCSSYGDEPEYPVLWINTSNHNTKVPFGDVVRMPPR